MKSRQLFALSALAIAASLAACGGGGGGTETTPTAGAATAVTPPVVGTPASSIVTTTPVASTTAAVVTAPAFTLANPPTSTYAVGSAEKTIFDQLNQIRIGGGFGALLQSAGLDRASKAHSDYVTTNYVVDGLQTAEFTTPGPDGVPLGHREKPGAPGFTGVTPFDRAAAAGSTFKYVGEEVGGAYGTKLNQEPDMTVCLSSLMNTVFHRAGMLDPLTTEVGFGIGAASVTKSGFIFRPCTIKLGSQRILPTLSQNFSAIYPFDQAVGLATTMTLEAPDPVPSAPVKGYPVSLQTAPQQNLVVTSFVLRDASNVVVNTKLITRADFPLFIRTNEAYLVPIGALAANTSYFATFAGTSNGTAINRSWTFKTGAN
jgi:uncharacterized protein YkwD